LRRPYRVPGVCRTVPIAAIPELNLGPGRGAAHPVLIGPRVVGCRPIAIVRSDRAGACVVARRIRSPVTVGRICRTTISRRRSPVVDAVVRHTRPDTVVRRDPISVAFIAFPEVQRQATVVPMVHQVTSAVAVSVAVIIAPIIMASIAVARRVIMVPNPRLILPRPGPRSWTPVVAITITVVRVTIAVVHVPGVVDADAGASIVIVVVRVTVIRVPPVGRVIDVQVVI